jgi:hypothetical protein
MLRRDDGVEVKEEKELEEIATNYLINLFSSTTGTRSVELMDHIVPCVTSEMNDSLIK